MSKNQRNEDFEKWFDDIAAIFEEAKMDIKFQSNETEDDPRGELKARRA